jgi:uncharacterized membrane protein
MKIIVRLIVGAMFFTVALLLSSCLLKDQAAGDWVDAALFIGFCVFMLSHIVFVVQLARNNSKSAR